LNGTEIKTFSGGDRNRKIGDFREESFALFRKININYIPTVSCKRRTYLF
jgi:hypothetical protein